jgi:hypothetical protein
VFIPPRRAWSSYRGRMRMGSSPPISAPNWPASRGGHGLSAAPTGRAQGASLSWGISRILCQTVPRSALSTCWQRPHHASLLRTRSWRSPRQPVRAGCFENKLVRRSYWLDMNDRTLVIVMVNGIGAHLTNDEKRAHLIDLTRDHLIEQVCVQEVLPPEKK